MKKQLLCLIFIITCSHALAEQSIVSYPLWQGRFGENILSFCFAKWISHRYNMPLHYRPFEYSDELVLHEYEQSLSSYDEQKAPIPLTNDSVSIMVLKNQGICYQGDFFNHTFDCWTYDGLLTEYNPEFKEELRTVLKPREKFEKINIPANHISVAAHIRRGGGFDRALSFEKKEKNVAHACYEDSRFPLKFPKDDFYIEQIAYLAEYFAGQKLYVHIFTDDKDPKTIAKKYTAALNNPNIVFGYRIEDNTHNAHVVEDFFAMTQFDCLIRPDSSYSKATQMIKDYKILIYPRGVTFVINDVAVEIRN